MRFQPHRLRTSTWHKVVYLLLIEVQPWARGAGFHRTVVLAHFVRLYGEYGYSPTVPFQDTG